MSAEAWSASRSTGGFPGVAWRSVAHLGTPRELAAGEVLVEAGSLVESGWALLEGRISWDAPEREFVPRLAAEEGAVLCAGALLSPMVSPCTIVAVEPTRLLEFSRYALEARLYDADPDVIALFDELVRTLGDDLRETNALLNHLLARVPSP